MTAQDWTDAFAPELLVMIEEVPAGLFLTGVGRLVLGVIFGVAMIALATVTGPGRDREAAVHMGSHFLTHPNAAGIWGLATASVATPQALATELGSLRSGIANQNFDLVRSAFMFSPADITSYFNSVNQQFSALFAPGPAALPPAPAGAAPSAEQVAAQVQAAVGYGQVF